MSVLAGVGITPRAGDGDDPIGEARRAEELGFDFVTVWDHLSGPKPVLETWTAMTWMLAATSRIRVVSTVLGLPFRPPALTAKMAETLQRLSGGRLVLGLGAGGSNDEFAALGVDVRTKSEKVAALEEALAIIRGVWTQTPFSFEGTHYRVREANIEPKPDPPIPIWLGTYGPRTLALTGRYADGWLPSMPYAPPSRHPALKERVVRAAEEAGRDPSEITYAYNVSVRFADEPSDDERVIGGKPAQVAEQLGAMIERLGLDAVNLWARGAEARETLATEIVPTLRG